MIHRPWAGPTKHFCKSNKKIQTFVFLTSKCKKRGMYVYKKTFLDLTAEVKCAYSIGIILSFLTIMRGEKPIYLLY